MRIKKRKRDMGIKKEDREKSKIKMKNKR